MILTDKERYDVMDDCLRTGDGLEWDAIDCLLHAQIQKVRKGPLGWDPAFMQEIEAA